MADQSPQPVTVESQSTSACTPGAGDVGGQSVYDAPIPDAGNPSGEVAAALASRTGVVSQSQTVPGGLDQPAATVNVYRAASQVISWASRYSAPGPPPGTR